MHVKRNNIFPISIQFIRDYFHILNQIQWLQWESCKKLQQMEKSVLLYVLHDWNQKLPPACILKGSIHKSLPNLHIIALSATAVTSKRNVVTSKLNVTSKHSRNKRIHLRTLLKCSTWLSVNSRIHLRRQTREVHLPTRFGHKCFLSVVQLVAMD